MVLVRQQMHVVQRADPKVGHQRNGHHLEVPSAQNLGAVGLKNHATHRNQIHHGRHPWDGLVPQEPGCGRAGMWAHAELGLKDLLAVTWPV